jgi:succinyl-diaminopimelate desuccinylase
VFVPTDLLSLTAQLVDMPSVSRDEQAITGWIEAELRPQPHLDVRRIGDNLVARSSRGHNRRVVLAGHTDTVPPNGNERARVDGDRVFGLGSTDMKSGLAVMLEAARTISDPAIDVTYVFYAREEIAASESGLRELFDEVPDLLHGDLALLGEPTDGALEAGCQGTMRVRVVLKGVRSHTARPWMGRNAIHRLAGLLGALAAYEPRQPVIQGCQYREALQAVRVEGGVAGNVVPDRAEVLLNLRFAPDRTTEEAEAHLRAVVQPWLEADDEVDVLDAAAGAPPGLDHPMLDGLVRRNRLEVRAKLGWTDVSRFASRGIPAANFGPGDPEIAHTAGEVVTRDQLDRVWAAVSGLLREGCD